MPPQLLRGVDHRHLGGRIRQPLRTLHRRSRSRASCRRGRRERRRLVETQIRTPGRSAPAAYRPVRESKAYHGSGPPRQCAGTFAIRVRGRDQRGRGCGVNRTRPTKSAAAVAPGLRSGRAARRTPEAGHGGPRSRRTVAKRPRSDRVASGTRKAPARRAARGGRVAEIGVVAGPPRPRLPHASGRRPWANPATETPSAVPTSSRSPPPRGNLPRASAGGSRSLAETDRARPFTAAAETAVGYRVLRGRAHARVEALNARLGG